jgi:phage shock protein A
MARSRRARAETEIRTTLSGLDEGSALASFERMEDKVSQQEARAAALGEVESDSVQTRFAALETADQVERDLAAMKAKNALRAAGGQTVLPVGT